MKRLYVVKKVESCSLNENGQAFVPTYPLFIWADTPVQLRMGEQWQEVAKGQLAFVHPNERIEMKRAKQAVDSLFLLFFQGYRLEEETIDKLTYLVDHSTFPAHGSVAGVGSLPLRAFTIVEQLVKSNANASGNPSDQASQHGLLAELLDLFARAVSTQTANPANPMHDVLDFTNRYYDQNLTRTQLAELSGYDASYFSRQFQKLVGHSFSEHLTRVRLDRAKLHLLTSEATLQEIAEKVGYADGFYLSRKFKQVIGTSPSAYRRMPKPQRIVALQFAGDLLALGIKPIAARFAPWESSPLIAAELDGVRNVEEIQSVAEWEQLSPDMVLAPDYLYYVPDQLEQLRRLEQIAPVLVLPWDRLDRLETVRLCGKLTGKEQEAEAWLQHYTARAEALAAKLAGVIQPEETVGLYELWEDNTICIWNQTTRGTYNLYSSLKLTPPPKIADEVLRPQAHKLIREEQLADYAADHMFVVIPREQGGDDLALTDHFRSRACWRELLKTGRHRLYPLPLEDFWCNDARALEKQREIMVDKLLAATALVLASR
ncbi:helix-turn-helix domain-containing protein [Brevibacillus sp. HD3.3A]|uniref:helix-turn-helix domain-containing protein n=1 Tax=Brevibacillus sp. HD3.3A TaxID=2738979 RepID=UPI00156BB72E|nr:helix-turn-helix domain-containing protein [Brevibacillus sp. HD3.3A]UED71840.1 helix-turn-helix domain-containing protein [Brevibacillus sp. HD3.3A]